MCRAEQPRSAWPSYDPDAPPSLSSAFYAGRRGWRGVTADVTGLDAAQGLTSLAVSHDGRRLAGVARTGRRVELRSGPLGTAPARRLVADTLTRPSFDRVDNLFTVATRNGRRWVAQVTAAGELRSVPTESAVIDRPVQELRLSRDGTRVAVVVGAAGAGRLVVGRVTSAHGALRFTGFRDVLPRVDDVRGVAWDGADQLVVTAANAPGGRELVAVDVDGYSTRTVSTVGLGGEPTDVAAAPDEPLVVTAGDAVWLDDPVGGWRRIGAGSLPAYAG